MPIQRLKQVAHQARGLADRVVSLKLEHTQLFMSSLAGLLEMYFPDGRLDPEIRRLVTDADQLGELLAVSRQLVQKTRSMQADDGPAVQRMLVQVATAIESAAGVGESDEPAPENERLIFVSFSREDEDLAAAFDKILSVAGVKTFKTSAPESGLPGGEAWFENIMKMLRTANGLVYVATPTSIKEHWRTFEVAAVFSRRNPALTILAQGLGHDDAPSPLKNIQNVTVDEPEELIKARIAFAVGRTQSDLWKEPVLEQLAAFLQLARKRSAKKEASNQAQQERKPVLPILDEAASTVEACELDWNAERSANPKTFDLAKTVMGRARGVIAPLYSALKKHGVQQGVLNILDFARKDAAKLEHYDPSIIGGLSRAAFWDTGADVLRRIQQVLSMEEVRRLRE